MSKKSYEQALVAGELKIGSLIIPCAVLKDGTRVISERGMGKALGRKYGGKDWKAKEGIEGSGRLPYFLTAKNLKAFINDDLELLGNEPIIYKAPKSGSIAHGIKAELIPNICDLWLKARDAGLLTKNQEKVANSADILMRGLAHVGIIALVDEATGYQYLREKNDLQRILSAYISEELLPWTARFPMEFYKEMFRLRGWQWNPIDYKKRGPRGPRYAGKLTNQLIYEKLPIGVLDELKKLNPVNEKWQRKNRLHQYLSEDIGNRHLEKQVAVVTAIMRISPNWRSFKRSFERAFPLEQQQIEMPFMENSED
jgi:hypothetical protein